LRQALPVQRLKTRVQFEAVMAAGRTVSRTEHFALHAAALDATRPPAPSAGPTPEQPATEGRLVVQPTGPGPARSPALFAVRTEPWLGVIVPKRWARRAVTRNAIKRQIYTVSQDFEAQLPVAAHVVRLRAGFDRTVFRSATSPELKKAVRLELQRLFAGVRR
jgi:ribonuclease P protein component